MCLLQEHWHKMKPGLNSGHPKPAKPGFNYRWEEEEFDYSFGLFFFLDFLAKFIWKYNSRLCWTKEKGICASAPAITGLFLGSRQGVGPIPRGWRGLLVPPTWGFSFQALPVCSAKELSAAFHFWQSFSPWIMKVIYGQMQKTFSMCRKDNTAEIKGKTK